MWGRGLRLFLKKMFISGRLADAMAKVAIINASTIRKERKALSSICQLASSVTRCSLKDTEESRVSYVSFAKIQKVASSTLACDKLEIGSTLTLNNGVKMPRFGLGVYKSSPGTETKQAVRWAVKTGYQMIDTAARYANEHDVGEVMKKENATRSSLFIVTKVWDDMHGYENTISSLKRSLKHLGLEYVDLFLIHSPVGGKIVETWKAMIDLMNQGYTRSIGVSNFGIHHLAALSKYSKVLPAVNQIEVHPFNQENAVVYFCKENGINIMAYSPLTRGLKLNHPVLTSIAKKHGKTSANVLIRWSLQKDLICIPKSVKERHIQENQNVFDFNLDAEDIKSLDLLEENFRTGQDRLNEKWMP